MNYTITVDWLQLLCSGTIDKLNITTDSEEEITINEDVFLLKNESKFNPRFQLTYDIFYDGSLFGTLYYKPRPKYRFESVDTIILTVENHILYESGYSDKLGSIIKAFKIKFIKYNELHIAIDGIDLIKLHNKYVDSTTLKRQTIVKVYPELDDINKVNKSYILGSRYSDKYITIYPKEQEMNHAPKPYIKNFWRENNLKASDGHQIDRLEMRIKKAKLLNDFDTNFNKLESPSYLASFFKIHGGGYVSFTYKKSKRQVSLVDWSVFGSVDIKKLIKVNYRPVKKSTFTALKTLLRAYRDTGNKLYFRAAAELAEYNGIKDTVMTKLRRWLSER